LFPPYLWLARQVDISKYFTAFCIPSNLNIWLGVIPCVQAKNIGLSVLAWMIEIYTDLPGCCSTARERSVHPRSQAVSASNENRAREGSCAKSSFYDYSTEVEMSWRKSLTFSKDS
jgi:hypothetical protein